jgi:hypothetical protein
MDDYLNLNLTEMDDNLEVDDPLSIGTESNTQTTLQKGGFFWSLDGRSEADKIALKAAQLRNYYVLDFFINQNLIKNYGAQDSDGCTILHYLVRESSQNVGPLVDKILARSDSKSFIDVQDKNGDTPLIAAVKAGNHEMADKLVGSGSDKTKKNKQGFYVLSESESMIVTPTAQMGQMDQMMQQQPQQQPQPQLQSAQSDGQELQMTDLSPEQLSETIRAVVNTFMQGQQQSRDTEATDASLMLPENLALSDTPQGQQQQQPMTGGGDEDTEAFLNSLISKYNQAGGAEDQETEAFLNSLLSKYGQSGGADGSTTDAVIDDFLNEENYGQCGGARFGRRKIPSYTDGAHESKPARELSRLIDDQSRENHRQAVDMILEKLGLSKDKEDDLRVAKRLKGALFKEVLRENREISSPLDLAAKLKEKVEGLKKTDMKKMVEGLDAHQDAVKIITDTMKVDDEVARNIKAVMWKNLRQENPNVSNIMLSVMLLEKVKKAKKKDLEKIDPEEGKQIREESQKRRAERKEKMGPKKGKKGNKGKKPMKPEPTESDVSATSPGEPPSMELSETSFSD